MREGAAAGRKPTMTDVAREAGVSLATVDRVLNGRGAVASEKEIRVLSVARRLRLDRSLRLKPTRTLRVAVLIQPPANPFHAALRHGLDLAARAHADLGLQLLVRHIDQNDPAAVAEAVQAEARRCEGLVVSLPDEAAIARALAAVATRVPVVTLATDILGSARAAYVGPDDRRAGRVAGDLMGRFLGRDGGEVVMVAGLLSLSGQRARAAGFREVLAERHPATRLAAVLESGEDGERAGRLAHRALQARPAARGLYLTSAGAGPVVAALRRLGRAEDTVLITHELTPDRRALLRERAIDAVIDQNPEWEARVAVETVARLLGRLEGEVADVFTDIAIHTAETA